MINSNPVAREGLLAIIYKDEGIETIATVASRYEALQYIRQVRKLEKPVDVVLTETRNGKLDGVQITRQIKDEFPEIAVLILTENPNDSFVIDAIHAGAGGYVFLQDMEPKYYWRVFIVLSKAAHK